MKKYILITIALLSGVLLSAQTLYTSRHDSIPATGDVYTLKTNPYRGNIQWQISTDGKTWNDLTDQTNSQVIIPTRTEAFYRAKISDNNCFVTYSDSAVVLLPRTQNVTVNPKLLTGTALLKSDSVSYSYKATGSSTIKPGTILLNTDSVSGIRIISGTVQKGDTITVQTTRGTMADLFVNQSFKLSTATLSNAQGIKGLTGAQLSRALTDTDGFIHPVTVVDNNPTTAKAKSTTTQADNIPLVSFGKDFSGQDIYNQNGIQLQFSTGYYNFNSELKCEFDFEQLKFDLAKLKITGGTLKRFSFYTDPDVTGIDAKLILLAKAGGEASFEKEKTLAKNIFNKSFKFSVGEIPVWMDVTMDLMAKVSGSISSELSVSGGASASAHLKLGATYQNGAWTPDTAFVKTFTLEGPTVTGKANEKLQVEVYPHISVKFYEVVGPYLDIAPYAREEMNLSISGNYDFGLYSGTNARLGINVEAFDKNVADWNHEFNLNEKELYKAPKKLKLISGDNQEGISGTALSNPIVLKVLDSNDNPIANYPVNFKSITGSARGVLDTNSEGEVSMKWTLDSYAGIQKLECYIENGSNKLVDSLFVYTTAKDTTTIITTSLISNINETTATCGGTITNNGGSTIIARGVCWNTIGSPTIADSKTNDGIGTGIFTSTLTGLKKENTYFVRAYLTNSKGTFYGETLSFFVCDQCKNPTIKLNSNSSFTLTDKLSGSPDIIDISGNFQASGLSYLIIPNNMYQFLSFLPPNKIKWENVGTRITKKVIVGYIVSQKTENECRADAIYVQPEEDR